MKSHRIVAAAATLALAATPVALAKQGEDHSGKGKEKSALKGTVVSSDADGVVVMVTKANKHGRHLVGTEQTFTATKVNVADTNGDLAYTTDDIADGDKVVVQVRIAKDATAPYAARHIVDQTNPKPEDEEVEEAEEAEEAEVTPVVELPAP